MRLVKPQDGLRTVADLLKNQELDESRRWYKAWDGFILAEDPEMTVWAIVDVYEVIPGKIDVVAHTDPVDGNGRWRYVRGDMPIMMYREYKRGEFELMLEEVGK